MKGLCYALWVFILLSPISCTKSTVILTLDHAAEIMNEKPDSAKAVLDSIKRSELRTRATRARFALLYSQAMDKCYIDTNNDSLISVALKYYSKQGTDHEKALAFYYNGVVYRNSGNIKATKYKELEKIPHMKNSLFLWEADRFSNEVAKKVLQWFNASHYVEFSSRHPLSPAYWENLGKPAVRKIFQNFMRDADLGIKDIFQDATPVSPHHTSIRNLPPNAVVEEITVRTLHPKFDEHGNSIGDVIFNLFEDESLGTQKYFYAIGPIIDTLNKGTTLFLDELDASLHPILTRRIVQLFNSTESNPKGAQLIFTSQDTNLLDQTLFDKEQIWFVEKDDYGCSHLTCLSEYKDIRKQEKIEQKYIMGKYGAIPYLGDFQFEED